MGEEEIVSDPLAIAQHVTKYLEESSAVQYLLAIERLDLESWKAAKDDLPGVNRANRQWKEGHIRDIVNVFCNQEVNISFLLRDLALLPGCDRNSIELASFISSAMYSVQTISTSITEKNLSRISSAAQTATPHPPPSSTTQQNVFNQNTINEPLMPANNSTAASSRQQLQPVWPTQPKDAPYKKPYKQRKWYQGAYQSSNREKQLPLTSLCLAVKSGSNETVDSLKEELKQWNYRDLTAELVTISDQHTLFRVKFKTATTLQHKWTEEASWPTRMSVSLWQGNPVSVLKPPHTRQFRKCIYIGNLSPTTPLNHITENVKGIYAEEIASNQVKEIETLINQEGTEHTMSRSVCVVLTSHPGQSLLDLPLKKLAFPYHLRRNIREWRGRPPWPKDHEMSQASIHLPHPW